MSELLRLLGQGCLFGLHLVCMNVASTAPLLALGCDWCAGRRNNRACDRAGRTLVAIAVLGLILGALLGLALGFALFAGKAHVFTAAYGRLAPRLGWAIYEFLFSVALLAGVWLWWRFAAERISVRGRGLRMLLLAAAATNLLYHFPPLFAVFAKVAAASVVTDGSLTSTELRAEFFQADVVSRWLHFVLAAFAAGGLALCLAGCRAMRDATDRQAEPLVVTGGRIALAATLAQVPVGMFVLLTLPDLAQSRLLGSEFAAGMPGVVGPALFLVSVLTALGLLHQLAAISFGQTEFKRVAYAAVYFVVTVVAMSSVLLTVRDTLGSAAPGANHRELSAQ